MAALTLNLHLLFLFLLLLLYLHHIGTLLAPRAGHKAFTRIARLRPLVHLMLSSTLFLGIMALVWTGWYGSWAVLLMGAVWGVLFVWEILCLRRVRRAPGDPNSQRALRRWALQGYLIALTLLVLSTALFMQR